MRTLFREQVGNRASGDDGEADAYLNRAWRFQLPDIVGGTFNRGEISFALTAGDDTYGLDSDDVGSGNNGVVRVPETVWLSGDGKALALYTRYEDFWCDFERTVTTQGRPCAVLFYGRTLTFRPVPTSGLTVYVAGSRYNAALTDAGVANESHALAAIHMAALHFAMDNEYSEFLPRLQRAASGSLELLSGQAHSAPSTPRRHRRDF